MPTKQTSHVPIIREWLQSLGVLTAVSVSRAEAEMKLAAYIPMLMLDFTDAAFTTASLNAVARQCTRGFPTYPELAAALSAWWREHRPVIALPPPQPLARRTPPTPDEIAAVEAITRTVIAELRTSHDAKQRTVNEQLAALGVLERPRAIHLTPKQLDAINPLPNGRKRAP